MASLLASWAAGASALPSLQLLGVLGACAQRTRPAAPTACFEQAGCQLDFVCQGCGAASVALGPLYVQLYYGPAQSPAGSVEVDIVRRFMECVPNAI